jgi:hypothetical protein
LIYKTSDNVRLAWLLNTIDYFFVKNEKKFEKNNIVLRVGKWISNENFNYFLEVLDSNLGRG